MTDRDPPVVHLDRPVTDEHRAYVSGRAVLVGPDDEALTGVPAAVIGASVRWDADRFARFPVLQVVSRSGVGYDNVDLGAATEAGVVVCNTPDAPTVSTAEHTIALLLAVTKELPTLQARAARGEGGPLRPTSLELDGAVLGLVGLGRISRRVAVAARGLGMTVIATDPAFAESPVVDVGMVSLDELLTSADVVSLHAPATDATRHLIRAETLARMPPGSYLVNCARGALVDHDALLAALDDGRLAGAGLDVTEPEPLPVGHPLLGRGDVVVTPHVASSTATGRRRLFEHAVENALAVLGGRPASTVVDPRA